MVEKSMHLDESRLLAAVLARGGGEGTAHLADECPLTQWPPVASRNACIWAVAAPYRVGEPRMMASASAKAWGSATGTWANTFLASTAPSLPRPNSHASRDNLPGPTNRRATAMARYPRAGSYDGPPGGEATKGCPCG